MGGRERKGRKEGVRERERRNIREGTYVRERGRMGVIKRESQKDRQTEERKR